MIITENYIIQDYINVGILKLSKQKAQATSLQLNLTKLSFCTIIVKKNAHFFFITEKLIFLCLVVRIMKTTVEVKSNNNGVDFLSSHRFS